MIQNYRLLKESATKFDQIKEVGGTSSPQIQKVYSTAHFLVMALRFQGLTKYLYLGRGGSFQGLYWFSKLPDPKYRIQKDRLLELFRKYFRSSRLNEIEVLETDRLFTMKCGNQYKYSNLYWFIKGSQAYASVEYQLDGNNAYYYHLWETKIQKRENAPNDFFVEFESLGLNRKEIKEYSNSNEQNISSEKEKLSWTEESYFRYLEEETKFKELSSKDKKKHLRKVENIKKDIIKIEKGLELGSLLTQDMFDIPQGHKIKLCGIKFIFNSTDNFYQKRDLIFKKFKRLKWALKMQAERLRELETKNNMLKNETVVTKIIQPVWFHRNENSFQKVNAMEYDQRCYYSVYKIRDNLELAVGKNAKGNDVLRNSWGHKNDMWFHVEGYTGAHIITKGDVLPEDFTLIGSILRDYSKLEIFDIPVIYAQLNKVKGMKGKAGTVTIKHPKHIQVIYLPNWRDKL